MEATKAEPTNPVFPTALFDRLQEMGRRVHHGQATELFWKSRPRSDRQILGSSFFRAEKRHGGAIAMCMKLNPDLEQPQAIIEVNRALGLIGGDNYESLSAEVAACIDRYHARRGGTKRAERPDPHELWGARAAELRRCRAACDLLLVRHGQVLSLYWLGKKIQGHANASAVPWLFLWMLVIARKQGLRLTDDWLEDRGSPLSAKDAKNRLRPLVPPDLFKIIKSRPGYWLDLDAQRIDVMDVVPDLEATA